MVEVNYSRDKKKFGFDHVFGPECKQAEVYRTIGKLSSAFNEILYPLNVWYSESYCCRCTERQKRCHYCLRSNGHRCVATTMQWRAALSQTW